MSDDPEQRALKKIEEQWTAAWPAALADWSPFVQMHLPLWCYDEASEKQQQLSGSFAMIRLKDHSIVISLRQIRERKLEAFGLEILAHEIGHHVLCPADLTDNARLIARVRRGLPGVESYSPYICNLYADLLINDRLQRSCGRRMSEVYRRLRVDGPEGKLWQLYMRTYEVLWQLEVKTLTAEVVSPRLNQDAMLAARLVRVYAKDWLNGAGRFACLCLPYVVEEEQSKCQGRRVWCDTIQAGMDGVPSGLSEIDAEEALGNLHPAEDSALTGLDPIDLGELQRATGGRVDGENSGLKTTKSYRDPFEYAEVIKAAGVNLGEREIAAQYYRERAAPHLIPFPVRISPAATDPFPEGLDLWEVGSEIEKVDWHSTLMNSPIVIPGVTTRERLVGTSPGQDPEKLPIDLYLGVDSSGSMRDPARTVSYPVLAGAIVCLSALRVGANVKVVLSGEPGKSVSTEGFIRDPREVLRVMVSYLGTGYAFGIHRLDETFGRDQQRRCPSHILIVSDNDLFSMLDQENEGRLGWSVAKDAIESCQGGGTLVLQISENFARSAQVSEKIQLLESYGWNVSLVTSMEDLVAFARQFSRAKYHSPVVRRSRT